MVKWGIIEPGTLWTLEKAVYGPRESPALWSTERDSKLRQLEWVVGKDILSPMLLVGFSGLDAD